MVAAAYLPSNVVNPTQKLVLMKIADSADDQTRLASPGVDRMVAWAGVGEKRVYTIVTELIALGLVERVQIGRAGRRAQYKVFPLMVPTIPSTEDLRERRTAARERPKNQRLARKRGSRGRPSPPARTHQDLEGREKRRADDREEAGLPEGNPASGGARVASAEPSGVPQGDPRGFPGETPVLPVPSGMPSTPLPPTSAGAGGGCPKHERPARNCRSCGTSPRQLRRRQREEEGRRAETKARAWIRAFVADRAERIARADPQAQAASLQEARAALRRKDPDGS